VAQDRGAGFLTRRRAHRRVGKPGATAAFRPAKRLPVHPLRECTESLRRRFRVARSRGAGLLARGSAHRRAKRAAPRRVTVAHSHFRFAEGGMRAVLPRDRVPRRRAAAGRCGLRGGRCLEQTLSWWLRFWPRRRGGNVREPGAPISPPGPGATGELPGLFRDQDPTGECRLGASHRPARTHRFPSI
jgi:hypothetical protein